MNISIRNIIFYSFLLMPLSFKISFFDGIYLYPQDIVFIVLLPIILLKYKYLKYNYSYLYIFIALQIMMLSTLIANMLSIDISSLFKVIKYSIYVFMVFVLINYSFKDFITKFNIIATITMSFNLLIFGINYILSGQSFNQFILLAMWDNNYIPAGFSNIVFNLNSFEFFKTTGAHGIFGSYIVLIIVLNIYLFQYNKKSFVIILNLILGILSLSILPSRESLLLLVVTYLIYLVSLLYKKKYYPVLVNLGTVFILLSVLLSVLFYFDISLSVIDKIIYSLESISSSGGEANVSMRFNTWYLLLLSITLQPFYLIFGVGYNKVSFIELLQYPSSIGIESNIGTYASIPESFFLQFLSYGGLFSFLLSMLFFVTIIYYLIRNLNYNGFIIYFLGFTIGLFITNNTGSSMLSDLFFCQYALFYIYLKKVVNEKKYFTHNS